MLAHHYSMPSFNRFLSAMILTFVLLFISHYFMGNTKNPVIKESNEFLIEFKDVNISYKYFGFDVHGCGESNVLIATLSRPNASDLRMDIRNSWIRDVPTTFTHKFFVGFSKNETLQKINENEAQKFGDIVFTNIIDSYLNLTLKMSSVFQWQHHFCPKLDFFLKTGEYSVLDISRFQYWLNLKFNMIKRSYGNSVIFGNVLQNNPVSRDPNQKWYVPYEAYNNSYYPRYQHGSCYLTTPYFIELMLKEAKNHKFITVDDAFFTGIIAEKISVRINASRHFAYQNPLATNSWDHECDDIGVPLLFSIVVEKNETELNGYDIALKRLKELKCSLEKKFHK